MLSSSRAGAYFPATRWCACCPPLQGTKPTFGRHRREPCARLRLRSPRRVCPSSTSPYPSKPSPARRARSANSCPTWTRTRRTTPRGRCHTKRSRAPAPPRHSPRATSGTSCRAVLPLGRPSWLHCSAPPAALGRLAAAPWLQLFWMKFAAQRCRRGRGLLVGSRAGRPSWCDAMPYEHGAWCLLHLGHMVEAWTGCRATASSCCSSNRRQMW
mmetsp:Transcript_9941/g.26999  ORF Transcript_9941/g.26999 Transcript_9941/m.26999 type:complete len:213 (+) Transcript_9941:485-1123(+)